MVCQKYASSNKNFQSFNETNIGLRMGERIEDNFERAKYSWQCGEKL